MRKKLLVLLILIATSLMTGCTKYEKCLVCDDSFDSKKMAYINRDYYCPDCTVDLMNSCSFGYCDNCDNLIMRQEWLWELNGRPLCGKCAYEEGRNSK